MFIQEVFDRWLIRMKLRRCARVGPETIAVGRIWIHGQGTITLGARVRLDGTQAPIEIYARLPTSKIVIGDDVEIGGGTSIEADDSIALGNRVVLGADVKIMDNHFHPLRGDRRVRPPSAPVKLDDDVRVGDRAILLPGTHLMTAAAVYPASVVSRRVPARAVVGGAPARVLK